jgi:hypothetical protein
MPSAPDASATTPPRKAVTLPEPSPTRKRALSPVLAAGDLGLERSKTPGGHQRNRAILEVQDELAELVLADGSAVAGFSFGWVCTRTPASACGG